MCELLGVSANQPVNIQFSLREFRHRGIVHYHGWGFAFFEENVWKIIKKPESLYNENIQEKHFKFKSKIIIGHVRLASCGNQVHENTHPFNIERWAFAHNGTISEIINHTNFTLGKWKPEGETDSEYAFRYLLHKLEENFFTNTEKVIEKEAEKIKKHGKFNFLLSDGEKLYAYGDTSLFYVKRKSPFQFATLRDDQYEVHLGEIKKHDEKAIVIATEPLTTNENWIKISGLKIFKDGEELN